MADQVLIWRKDPRNPGVHNMRPVLQSDYMKALEQAVIELSGNPEMPAVVLDSCDLAYEMSE